MEIKYKDFHEVSKSPETWKKHTWNEWFKWTQIDDINLKIHKAKKKEEHGWNTKALQIDIVSEVKKHFILVCINNP